jgi:hypothetical protein
MEEENFEDVSPYVKLMMKIEDRFGPQIDLVFNRLGLHWHLEAKILSFVVFGTTLILITCYKLYMEFLYEEGPIIEPGVGNIPVEDNGNKKPL